MAISIRIHLHCRLLIILYGLLNIILNTLTLLICFTQSIQCYTILLSGCFLQIAQA